MDANDSSTPRNADPPKPLEENFRFCDVGAHCALNFMRACSATIEKIGAIETSVLKREVDDAFDELRMHWLSCSECNDDPTEAANKTGRS
jgi:hypothetical protein